MRSRAGGFAPPGDVEAPSAAGMPARRVDALTTMQANLPLFRPRATSLGLRFDQFVAHHEDELALEYGSGQIAFLLGGAYFTQHRPSNLEMEHELVRQDISFDGGDELFMIAVERIGPPQPPRQALHHSA